MLDKELLSNRDNDVDVTVGGDGCTLGSYSNAVHRRSLSTCSVADIGWALGDRELRGHSLCLQIAASLDATGEPCEWLPLA